MGRGRGRENKSLKSFLNYSEIESSENFGLIKYILQLVQREKGTLMSYGTSYEQRLFYRKTF